ncbi:predicted protein, partial [Nematostella vectensis]
VRGLAVDWESSLLYFTDYFYEEIGIVTYDGKRNKTLITAGVANPHGIAVDPSSGYMFWTDWGNKARIQRASLSGHNQTTLVDLQSSTQNYPHGIALDLTARRVYWIESATDQILSVDYDGHNERSV